MVSTPANAIDVTTAGAVSFNGTSFTGSVLSGAYGGTGIANTGLTIDLSSGAASKVLTSDSSGNGTWQSVAGVSREVGVQAFTGPGTNPVLPTTGGLITVDGGTVAAGTVPVQTNSLAANTYTVQVQTSQALAAADATKIGLANFDSGAFSVDSTGFVTLKGGTEAIDSIGTQTGTNPILPTSGGLVTINGAVVAAGTNPVRSDGTGANTMALEVQISQAIAATDATKIGLCNFSSAHFTVDANGFVSATGGTGFSSIVVQTFTSSGTYTPTSGMAYCTAEIVGGGGGGGSSPSLGTTGSYGIGGGGGAGGYARKTFSAATIGASQSVTIGGGGAADASGTSSSLGYLISATGGTNGASNTNAISNGGNGGSGSSGDVNTVGQAGSVGFASIPSSFGISGIGGSVFFGGGAKNVAVDIQGGTPGIAASSYGGGGSGGAALAVSNVVAAQAGGAGAGGIVIITEYVI